MKLAVVFPGIGYHADKPLLYYSKKLAAQAGWQVVEVAYGAFPDRVKGDRAKMEKSFRIAMEGAEKYWQLRVTYAWKEMIIRFCSQTFLWHSVRKCFGMVRTVWVRRN